MVLASISSVPGSAFTGAWFAGGARTLTVMLTVAMLESRVPSLAL